MIYSEEYWLAWNAEWAGLKTIFEIVVENFGSAVLIGYLFENKNFIRFTISDEDVLMLHLACED